MNAGGISAVLSYTLPKREQEVCRILVLEQEVDFINEDIGLSAPRLVCGNSIEDIIKHHKHSDRHQCSAEIVMS